MISGLPLTLQAVLLLSFLRISSRVQPSPSGYVPFLSFDKAKSIILAVLVDNLIIGRCDIRFTTVIYMDHSHSKVVQKLKFAQITPIEMGGRMSSYKIPPNFDT